MGRRKRHHAITQNSPDASVTELKVPISSLAEPPTVTEKQRVSLVFRFNFSDLEIY